MPSLFKSLQSMWLWPPVAWQSLEKSLIVFDIDTIVQDFDIKFISICSSQYLLVSYGLCNDFVSTLPPPPVPLTNCYTRTLTATCPASECFILESACYYYFT
jgi:hypothetical protein